MSRAVCQEISLSTNTLASNLIEVKHLTLLCYNQRLLIDWNIVNFDIDNNGKINGKSFK